MLLLLTLALQAAQAGPTSFAFDIAKPSSSINVTSLTRCGNTASSDEIVVCGARRDRYRLPLPDERGPSDHLRNEAPSGMAALIPAGRCGIFAGERRCNNRENAQYGYGDGCDPITLVSRLAQKAVDPDTD